MSRNKNAQAALEFLITYGWAFLVILVMIGALAHFGVLDPAKFQPEYCIAEYPFECKEAVIVQSNVSGTDYASAIIILLQNKGSQIILEDVLTPPFYFDISENCAESQMSQNIFILGDSISIRELDYDPNAPWVNDGLAPLITPTYPGYGQMDVQIPKDSVFMIFIECRGQNRYSKYPGSPNIMIVRNISTSEKVTLDFSMHYTESNKKLTQKTTLKANIRKTDGSRAALTTVGGKSAVKIGDFEFVYEP